MIFKTYFQDDSLSNKLKNSELSTSEKKVLSCLYKLVSFGDAERIYEDIEEAMYMLILLNGEAKSGSQGPDKIATVYQTLQSIKDAMEHIIKIEKEEKLSTN